MESSQKIIRLSWSIAHMDTSPDMSGKNVTPRIVEKYDGSDIVLCAEENIVLSPSQLHVDMHGKVFDFDDPPFIGVMYGERVHGLPGTLPNCRCLMKPIFEFESEEND